MRRIQIIVAGLAVVLMGSLVAWWMHLATGAQATSEDEVLPLSVTQVVAPANSAASEVPTAGTTSGTGAVAGPARGPASVASGQGRATGAAGGATTAGDAGSTDGGGAGSGSGTTGTGTTGTAVQATTSGGALLPDGLVSAQWLTQTAVSTGIPSRVLRAYAGASIVEAQTRPGCHLGWNTLAGIGEVESHHGTANNSIIAADGWLVGSILGPVVDSDGTRAVGPMQFLPSTWTNYGVDANGDGKADPDQIDDAVMSAANYLCVAGGDLSTGSGWTTAVYAYNHDNDYVNSVRQDANDYAAEAGR